MDMDLEFIYMYIYLYIYGLGFPKLEVPSESPYRKDYSRS